MDRKWGKMLLLLLAVMLAGGMVWLLYEYARYGDSWVFAPENPHVFDRAGLALGRITDREGNLLTELGGGRAYGEERMIRSAVCHWTGDRAGNIQPPFLKHYRAIMVGYDPVSGIYAYGGPGSEMRLTISAQVQVAALEAMEGYKGTVAVYNYRTGQILCALSTPTMDPDAGHGDRVDEGVYWNRFYQSVYIPGSIFKIVTTAAALEALSDIRQQHFVCTGEYDLPGGSVTCEKAHGKLDLKDAMLCSCNCAYAQIAQQLGGQRMEGFVRQFGVIESVSFDGITTPRGNFRAMGQTQAELAWSAVGQHLDQVNPCAFLSFLGAVANGGQGVRPYLVQWVCHGGKRVYSPLIQREARIMSGKTAGVLTEYMANNVRKLYGAENFSGMTVCAKTGTGQVGGTDKPNATFAGFVLDDRYPLAFFVCAEDAGYGKTVCVPIAAKVLAACKGLLDGSAE